MSPAPWPLFKSTVECRVPLFGIVKKVLKVIEKRSPLVKEFLSVPGVCRWCRWRGGGSRRGGSWPGSRPTRCAPSLSSPPARLVSALVRIGTTGRHSFCWLVFVDIYFHHCTAIHNVPDFKQKKRIQIRVIKIQSRSWIVALYLVG